MKLSELQLLIAEGEGLTVEFKEKYTSKIDKGMVALANSKGGYIILGVNDAGKVTGEKLTNSMKAEILSLARNCEPHIVIPKISQVDNAVVIEVSEGDEKPYSCSTGYFRRLDAVTQKLTQQEVRTIFRETADKLFEALPRKDCHLSDLSMKKVEAFLVESKTDFKVTKQNLASFLASIGVYDNGVLNNAGVLMFSDNAAKFMPYVEMICCAFKGRNKTFIYDRKDVRSDLLTQFNEGMAFIQRQLNIRSEIRGVNRTDIYELPLDAIREALVNAIVHRDYSIRGASLSVDVYDDRVEIVSPGGLPQGLDRADFGTRSVRRNLIIADLFHRMGKVERIGSGIGRMQNILRAANLEAPKFIMTTFFTTIFLRDPEYANKGLKEADNSGVEKTTVKSSVKGSVKSSVKSSVKIMTFIGDDKHITIPVMAEKLGLTTRAIEKQLVKLQSAGKIRRVGPDKGGHWELVK